MRYDHDCAIIVRKKQGMYDNFHKHNKREMEKISSLFPVYPKKKKTQEKQNQIKICSWPNRNVTSLNKII